VEILTAELILAKLMQAGGETPYSEIHTLVIFIIFEIRKRYLNNGRSLLLYQLTRRMIKLIAIIVKAYHCYQLQIKLYPISFPQA
jgi:hypothetical protein